MVHVDEFGLLYYALWLDGKTRAIIWTNGDSHVHLLMLGTSW